MFAKVALLSLLTTSVAARGAHLAPRQDELTTTSTEYVYVTVTQTLPLSSGEVGYTTIISPSIPTPNYTTIVSPSIPTPYCTDAETTSAPEVTYGEDTTTMTLPANSTSWTTSYVPSGGYYTTIKANETTISTHGPNPPRYTDTDSGAEGLKISGVLVMLGAVVAMF